MRRSSKNSDAGSTLVISRSSLARPRKLEQVPFSPVDLLQVGIISNNFDAPVRKWSHHRMPFRGVVAENLIL